MPRLPLALCDAIKMKLCSTIWAWWKMLSTPEKSSWQFRDRCGSNERGFKSIVCSCNKMVNQQRPKKKRQTHEDVCQSLGYKGESYVSLFWASEPPCLSEGHVLITLPSLSFLGHRPTSCGPGPLLLTAAQFNLPNAVMGQANQLIEKRWGPAKHFQLWHMWKHFVKCYDNIKRLVFRSHSAIRLLAWYTEQIHSLFYWMKHICINY